jgi:SOS-response transcriptional repressor LexA
MLTRRQRDCLDAIEAHFEQFGRAPSVREIALRMRIRSVGNVNRLIAGLVERGFITRTPQVAYGIECVHRTQFFKFNEETKELEPLRSK